MPALPWRRGPYKPAAAPMVVLASRFQLRRYRDVVPFFVAALRIDAQVRRSEGAVGLALIAQPLRRTFYTLSAWRDHAAIDAMIATEPHRSVMARYHELTTDSHFTTWSATGAAPPTWQDARDHLRAPISQFDRKQIRDGLLVSAAATPPAIHGPQINLVLQWTTTH